MQNLIVMMDPPEKPWEICLKGGSMILNRLCIDEDAAFELSGVNYFQKSSRDICYADDAQNTLKRKQKGQEYIFQPHTV